MSSSKIFISRASADADVSEQIARILEVAGYDVTVQQRDFVSRNFIEAMDAALVGGARVVALLSADYLKSDYCRAEWMNAIATDPLNKKQRLVVLRISPCEPEGLLAGIIYHDLVPYLDDPSRFASAVLGSVRESRDADALTRPAARPVAPPPAPPAPARRGWSMTTIALGVLGIALVAGTATKILSGAAVPPPTTSTTAATSGDTARGADGAARLQAVRSYYADWNDRRLAEMWATLSPAFHDRTDHGRWSETHSHDKSIRVESLRDEGGDTVLATVVSTSPGSSDEQTYHVAWHLIFQNGRWLLDSYTQ